MRKGLTRRFPQNGQLKKCLVGTGTKKKICQLRKTPYLWSIRTTVTRKEKVRSKPNWRPSQNASTGYRDNKQQRGEKGKKVNRNEKEASYSAKKAAGLCSSHYGKRNRHTEARESLKNRPGSPENRPIGREARKKASDVKPSPDTGGKRHVAKNQKRALGRRKEEPYI